MRGCVVIRIRAPERYVRYRGSRLRVTGSTCVRSVVPPPDSSRPPPGLPTHGMPKSAGLAQLSERALKWHVYRSRKHSDTRPEFLLEIARCVTRLPSEAACAPLLEVGTRSGG